MERHVAKVLILSPLPEGLVGSLFAEHTSKYNLAVNFVTVSELDVERIKKELADTDVVIGDFTFKIPVTAEMCEAMTKVKLIQQPSTGYDHIDIAACSKKAIPVANIGGANSVSVAEYTIALALNLLKRITYSHQKLLQGIWAQDELLNVSTELQGKTWGIIGLGRIGREVASRARALGGDVIYYDIARRPEEEEAQLGVAYREFHKLLSESDIVSLHVPVTETTRKMIGERELRLMKPSSVFINPARGELTDETALAKAVRDGWIGGAGIDVFSREPPPSDHPLVLAAKEGANILLTPHTAGATTDARMRIIQVTVENVVRVLLGQKPQNVVNR
jgi:phosphoglycerate dehydrogenase-like enzyme